MVVIVTGASGDLGSRTAELLLEALPPGEVILTTRTPAALERFSARGAKVREANFDDEVSLRAAFAGGDRMLLVSTLDVGERRRRQHRTAIDAARAAGVRHIVYTSSAGIHPRNPCFVIPDHAATEDWLKAEPIDHTILRISGYAENVASAIAPHAVATGKWISAAGEGRVGFVSKTDCARVACAVLTTPGHEGAVYEITGPEMLSFRDAAGIASEVSGVPIEYVTPGASTAHEASQQEQADQWIGPFSMRQLGSYEQAVSEGFYAICTGHVELVTKRPARALREVFMANRAALLQR